MVEIPRYVMYYINYPNAMFGNEDFIWKFRIDLNSVFGKLIKTKFEFVSILPLY